MAESIELAKAYVQIVPSARGMASSISEELGGASIGESAGESIGSGLVSKIKGLIGAAAIGEFLKSTIEAGANLEQSFGGLDTIYGEASDTMKQFAADAATSGISMNNYAEQAVSMGAALKNSLGGDAVAAAEKANTAILDMADNSAKMGTDLESLQNAYVGFSRGNYTMLDNLSLGYAGTKEGMQELLDKAEELSGIEYDISSYSDIVDAIHVVQDSMGIAGVAAEEASTTFSGSLNAMKASFENLQATLFSGGDISGAMSSLVSSVSTFLFQNLVPAVFNIAKTLPQALVSGIQTALPLLMTGAQDIITELITFITTDIPQLITSAQGIVAELANDIVVNLPTLLMTAGEMINSLVSGISSAMPTLMNSAADMLLNFVNTIIANLPQIVAAAVSLVQSLVSGLAQNLPAIVASGIEMTGKLAAGLIQAIPSLVAQLPSIVSSISDYINNTDWASIGVNIIKGIASGLSSAADQLWTAVKDVIGDFKDQVLEFFGIHSPATWGIYVGKMIDAGFAGGITGNAGIVQKAVQALTASTTMPINTAISASSSLNGYQASGTSTKVVDKLNKMIDTLANVGISVTMEGQTMEVDGRAFAYATASYTSNAINRNEKIQSMITGVK